MPHPTLPALAAALVLALPTWAAHAQTTDLDAAHAAYADGRHAAAYAAFARLADAGHADAAQIAWLMQRHGESLYGRRFEATPYQQLAWAWRWQCGGCTPPIAAASGC